MFIQTPFQQAWNLLWNPPTRAKYVKPAVPASRRCRTIPSRHIALFEEVMWWWCELDASPAEDAAAEDVAIELGELMKVLDNKHFTAASIKKFSKTVDGIKSKKEALGYVEITTALRDAYRYLLINPCL